MNMEKAKGTRLKDKVVIVTGGAYGIGRSFCLGMAEEGAIIVISDIDVTAAERTAEEVQAKGCEVLVIKADVSSVEDTLAMAEKTVERFGRIDVLINNAAIFSKIRISIAPFNELNLDEWDRVMAVNLKGPFLCSRAVFPYMKKQDKGSIVNIASTAGFYGVPAFLHYSTSKGGVMTMTRGLATALGDFNINVNAVAPGAVMTETMRVLVPEEAAKQMVEKNQIIKRSIQPEDIAAAVVFLASDEADKITGQTLAVNAGEYLH